jgi:hypothetical protein
VLEPLGLTEPPSFAELAVTDVAPPVLHVGLSGVLVQTVHPLLTQVVESAVPSAHFVTPPIQATPPWEEQQPVQSARAVPARAESKQNKVQNNNRMRTRRIETSESQRESWGDAAGRGQVSRKFPAVMERSLFYHIK